MKESKEVSKGTLAKKLELMDFSGDENLSPEIIDDALNSTTTFNKNVNIGDIAKRIKHNKANYGTAP